MNVKFYSNKSLLLHQVFLCLSLERNVYSNFQTLVANHNFFIYFNFTLLGYVGDNLRSPKREGKGNLEKPEGSFEPEK